MVWTCSRVLIAFLLLVSAVGQTRAPSVENKPPPSRLSDETVKRLRDSRQYDLEIIAGVNSVLTSASSNDAVTAYCRFSVKQMEALTASGSTHDSQTEWLEEQKVGACRARVLTGLDRMPSLDEFREYAAKAERDLKETNQKLTNTGIVLEAPSTTTPENQTQSSLPVILRRVEPEYSEQARRANFNGEIRVSVTVDEHGNIDDIRFLSSQLYGLEENITKALHQWKLKPAVKDGKPIPSNPVITFTFRR